MVDGRRARPVASTDPNGQVISMAASRSAGSDTGSAKFAAMASAPNHPENETAPEGGDVPEFFRIASANDLELEAYALFRRIGKLELLAAWDEVTTRDVLGCDLAKFAEAGAKRAARSLRLSHVYLAWVFDVIALLGDMPSPAMVRRIVVATRVLFDGAGGARDGDRLERCRAAVSTEHGLPFRPRDYVSLGEVQRAFEIAAQQLPGSEAARRAGVIGAARAPFQDVSPHVAPQRMALLGSRDGLEELGAGVHDAIVAHLHSGCAACNDALPSDVPLPRLGRDRERRRAA
jgi:hypothetical protein